MKWRAVVAPFPCRAWAKSYDVSMRAISCTYGGDPRSSLGRIKLILDRHEGATLAVDRIVASLNVLFDIHRMPQALEMASSLSARPVSFRRGLKRVMPQTMGMARDCVNPIDAISFLCNDYHMQDYITALLSRIQRHLKKTKQTPSRFGREVARNSSLIDRLRAGQVTVSTIEKIEKHLDAAEKGC